MKAALYARVSTSDKHQNPEVQLDKLRAYCDEMGWTAIEYVDYASAADFIKRTQWSQLMKDAAQRKFQLVLVWKLDRAFRSMIHAANTLNMLRSYNIGFRSMQESAVDTSNAMGELVFNILASVAQFERDIIAQRVRAGLDYAKAKGTRSGNAIGRPRYEIPVNKVCNALYEGKSYHSAAKILSDEYKMAISPGFVQQRIRRGGLTKEQVLDGLNTVYEILPGGKK